MTAALAMGSNKITGMADPTSAQDAATKNYVDTSFATAWSTGDVKLTVKIVADTGWLLFADQTIGNVGSGATYANANALALYTLLWNNISSPTANAFAPVTGGLGANAAADWAGLKPMLLLKTLGRALAVAGAGSGLTSRALGSNVGTETVTIAQSGLPNIVPTFTGTAGVATSTNTNVAVNVSAPGNVNVGGTNPVINGTAIGNLSSTFIPVGTISSINGNTTQTATANMQPSAFLNAMIRL